MGSRELTLELVTSSLLLIILLRKLVRYVRIELTQASSLATKRATINTYTAFEIVKRTGIEPAKKAVRTQPACLPLAFDNKNAIACAKLTNLFPPLDLKWRIAEDLHPNLGS